MKIKRIAAIILVFSLLTAMFSVAKAQEPVSEPFGESTTVAEIETTEPSTSAGQEETTGESTENTTEEIGSETVALMSICARATGFPAFFHVWIYIQNLSDETLRIGAYDLPAGEGVSIGSWGMMVTDFWGVYYNVESFASKDRDSHDYYSLSKELDMQDVEKVSEEVRRFNYWDPIFNCTVFAYRVWDCVDGKWLFPFPLPWITLIQLAIHGADTGELEMFVPERTDVFRQKGWGDEATLVETEDWALKSIVAES